MVLVPILLKFWGASTYGIWLSLFAIFSLLQSLDTGHVNYVGNKINILYHNDTDQLKKTLGSGLMMAFFLFVIVFLISLVLIVFGYIDAFIGLSPSQSSLWLSYGLIILMIMWWLCGAMGGLLVRLLIPAGLLFEFQWWGILTRGIQFLSVLSVAFSGGGVFAAIVFYSLSQLVVTIFLFYYIKRKLPVFFPWWQERDWRCALDNFKGSLFLSFNAAIQQAGSSGIVILVANLFQAAAVPTFTTIKTLSNTAQSLTNIFITSVMPDIIRFHATGERKKMLNLISFNWFVTGAIVNIGIVIILPFIEKIYLFWTRGHLEFNFTLFLLLASSISFFNFGNGINAYLAGINDTRSQTVMSVVRVLVLFVCSYFLAHWFGIISVGIGTLGSEIVCSVFLTLYFANRHLRQYDESLSSGMVRIAILPPAMIMVIGISCYWTRYTTALSLFGAFCMGLVYLFNWRMLDSDIQHRVIKVLWRKNPGQ